MHILVIPSWYPTQDQPIAGTFFRQQVQALKRAGLQVGVIYPHYRSLRLLRTQRLGWPYGFRYEIDEGVPTYRYDGWSWSLGFPQLFYHLWVRLGKRLFKRYIQTFGQPDLIHAHGAIYGGILAKQIHKETKQPYVITEHITGYALGWVRRWQLPLVAGSLQQANARLVVSPALGQQLEKSFGDAVQPWVWVPNVIDPEIEATPLRTGRTPGQPFRFLNVARMEGHKRQQDLLQAFATRFQGQPHVELRLAGDGPCRPQLERQAKLSGIGQQVHFLGWLERPQILAEMQAADTFVLSSQYETFGVVLIEALACGKPVISTACGGPEYIVNEKNGLLVPVQDVIALGTALEQMVMTSKRYDPLKLRNACLQEFGEKAVVDRLYSVYQQVLSAAGNP